MVHLASPWSVHQGIPMSLQMLVHSDSRIRPTSVWPGDKLDNLSFAAKTLLVQ